MTAPARRAQARKLSDDALQDTAASLRMAEGIIRELELAGALVGHVPDGDEDLDVLLDLVRDALACHRPGDAAEVLRLTERRLVELADLIDGRTQANHLD